MPAFPKIVQELWNEWEIRLMVLLSLCSQIVLIIFGNKRKRIARPWVGAVVWISYLSADWVATVSLGMIARIQTNSCDKSLDPNNAIMLFWAPFLLVHLGGPDTITAYSLQDNELWLRHFLGLLVHVGVVFYVFILSWGSNNVPLTFLAIVVIIPGVFKYGERTWVLWSASSERFRKSLIPPPQAGKDYVAKMAEYSVGAARELYVSYHMLDAPVVVDKIDADMIIPEAKLLVAAESLFKIFKRLYAGIIFGSGDITDSITILPKESAEDAFKVIELELGMLYDLLYSKAFTAHSKTGMFLRSISFLSSVTAFVVFLVAIDKHSFSNVNVTVTYLLLVGAIFIEIYAGIILIFSEWNLIRLTKHKKWMGNFIYGVVSSSFSASINRKRWSCSMAQYNLIGFCLKDKPTKCVTIQKFFWVHEKLEKSRYKTWKKVTTELKKLIFQQIIDITGPSMMDIEKLCCKRGDYVLEMKSCLDKFSWSVVEVGFDHSILLWHIATDLCYYSESDLNRYQNDTCPSSNYKLCKLLSDYMLYLLVMCPLTLPQVIEERYRDTCADAISFLDKKSITTRIEACKSLMKMVKRVDKKTDIAVKKKVIGDNGMSVLFDGCRLAKSLQALETEEQWESEEKWELISEVWIEMLCYAAIQCKWNHHAQLLSRGGELLTHVSLLMAHLGVNPHFEYQRDLSRRGAAGRCNAMPREGWR